jgi:hypothetical protein
LIRYKILLIFIIVLAIGIQAQKKNTFGFGCLGLVGGFAGYEIKNYTATGLNNYVKGFNEIRGDSLQTGLGDFGQLKGYRVGLNLLRNRDAGLEYTIKVFYEALTELKEAQIRGKSGMYKSSLELKQNVFGAGIEIGTPLSKSLSWKILELEATYGNAQLFNRSEDVNDPVSRVKYTSENYKFGFNFASGFILFIIDENVSLEGKMGYSVFSVGYMTDEEDNKLTVRENSTVVMENLITKGGLFYGVQFNISIPL